jgi:hypothetical protein
MDKESRIERGEVIGLKSRFEEEVIVLKSKFEELDKMPFSKELRLKNGKPIPKELKPKGVNVVPKVVRKGLNIPPYMKDGTMGVNVISGNCAPAGDI